MKLTRRQLRKLIKESVSLNEGLPLIMAGIGAYALAGYVFGKTYHVARVNNADSLDPYINMAGEIQYSYEKDKKVIEDLIEFASKCEDPGLIGEITQYIEIGELLSELIPGFDPDMTDALGLLADGAMAKQAATASSAMTVVLTKGIPLKKKNYKNSSKLVGRGVQRSLGAALGILFAGLDIYQVEVLINEVKDIVDLDRLQFDIQGFRNLHRQMIRGELPCAPVQPNDTSTYAYEENDFPEDYEHMP